MSAGSKAAFVVGANRLYHGDNLEILRRHIADESVDLVYLDPPFNTRATYTVGEGTAFEDNWRWDQRAVDTYRETTSRDGKLAAALHGLHLLLDGSGMLAYLLMMAPRLEELRRVLKPSGSVYLHCDPTASHYLKVLLDAIFGADRFRNELIWSYGGRGAKAIAHQFPRNHDVILVYSKDPGASHYRQQSVRRVISIEEARRRGVRRDTNGRWFKTAPPGDYSAASIERLEAAGRVHRTRTGGIRIKYFMEEEDGHVVEEALVGDVWQDIPDAMHLGKERLGYPTQKPEALLERVILASSDKGDTVLDPFAGCGTTIAVAQHLGRRWIGIDSSPVAIDLMRKRLAASAPRSRDVVSPTRRT